MNQQQNLIDNEIAAPVTGRSVYTVDSTLKVVNAHISERAYLWFISLLDFLCILGYTLQKQHMLNCSV
jgi:hypothetical protein